MHATGVNLYSISTSELNGLNEEIAKRKDNETFRSAYAFLSVFSNADVFRVFLEPYSLHSWQISSFTKQRLVRQLQRKEVFFKDIISIIGRRFYFFISVSRCLLVSVTFFPISSRS